MTCWHSLIFPVFTSGPDVFIATLIAAWQNVIWFLVLAYLWNGVIYATGMVMFLVDTRTCCGAHLQTGKERTTLTYARPDSAGVRRRLDWIDDC